MAVIVSMTNDKDKSAVSQSMTIEAGYYGHGHYMRTLNSEIMLDNGKKSRSMIPSRVVTTTHFHCLPASVSGTTSTADTSVSMMSSFGPRCVSPRIPLLSPGACQKKSVPQLKPNLIVGGRMDTVIPGYPLMN